MSTQDTLDFNQHNQDDSLLLGSYAQQAYLEYALSVVKGRALPQVSDGQKPVQRRILYAMLRLGLAWQGANGAKPVKSARVVGDVLGRFHPHGDQAAYDALVRMAQDFAQRYPLVDGQGNFGSRDGDGAAAMRYTEARLTPLARLLMEELDEGTVDFRPNYDGSTEEPVELPARLPFVLLNGASGIAVGMATEVPSHNLREVAEAAVALLKNPQLADDELFGLLPGPDFPGGAQIISTPEEIRSAYATGRGSLKLRARWKVEDLARGQWQLVITELPHGVSSQKVLEEIEEISNPKVKTGKKAVTPEQLQLKNSLLAVLDGVRDESSKDAAVRLVFEPKSRTVSVDELTQVLLALTSLETSSTLNLTMVGLDGKPVQKNLRQILAEWLSFRQATVERRSRHRLAKAEDRIHILEGRQAVLLNIDEVIRIIRNSDEPKPALIEAFRLSDRQAEDILEIRLRQLARLEAIKIEQELKSLREEADKLRDILANPATLKRLLVKEIEADAKQFGDARRTLIQAEKRASNEIKVIDEPVTVVVSSKGCVRALKGHEVDAGGLSFKRGRVARSERRLSRQLQHPEPNLPVRAESLDEAAAQSLGVGNLQRAFDHGVGHLEALALVHEAQRRKSGVADQQAQPEGGGVLPEPVIHLTDRTEGLHALFAARHVFTAGAYRQREAVHQTLRELDHLALGLQCTERAGGPASPGFQRAHPVAGWHGAVGAEQVLAKARLVAEHIGQRVMRQQRIGLVFERDRGLEYFKFRDLKPCEAQDRMHVEVG